MKRLDDAVLKFVDDLPTKVTFPNIIDSEIAHCWNKGRKIGLRVISKHLRHNLGAALPTFRWNENFKFRSEAQKQAFLDGYNAVKRCAEAFIDHQIHDVLKSYKGYKK